MASLLALSRAASEHSKTFLQWRLLVHALMFLLAITALLLTEKQTVPIAFVSGAVEILAWVLRQRGRIWHNRAEEARRIWMLMDGFRYREPAAATDLRAQFNKAIARKAVKLEDANYYASKEAPGARRLREILVECAFWSKHLYRCAFNQVAVLTAVSAIVVIGGAIANSAFASPHTNVIVGRSAVAFLLALMYADVLTQTFEWHSAAGKIEGIDKDLQHLQDAKVEDLLPLFAEYSVATAHATPIPTYVYKQEAAKLNALWAQRKNQLFAGESAAPEGHV